MNDLRCLSELLTDAFMKGFDQESAFGCVVPLVTYNLDWEHYLLVQVWDRFTDTEPKWAYSLWHHDGNWRKVRDFSEDKWEDGAPYVKSAIAVEADLLERGTKKLSLNQPSDQTDEEA